jgi:outer membrane protein assembly factor BamE
MQKRLLPFLFLALAGCSDLEFPWVYRINVDQGNIITQEMVNQLMPGMSRGQVQFVMGSALLVDTFQDDRWDYVYTLQDGKGKRTQQRLTVFFQEDKLSAITGDFAPQMEDGQLPAPKTGRGTVVNPDQVEPSPDTQNPPPADATLPPQ